MKWSPARRVLAGLGALVVLWIGWRVADGLYLTPRATLADDIERRRVFLANAGAEADHHLEIDRSIQAFADRTLGSDRESTDHALRSTLNRIGAVARLAEQTVTTRAVTPRRSPARREIRDRTLRDAPDFVELEGTLTGRGTLEQAVDVVCRLEAEPWIKRIGQLRLDPLRDPEQMTISLTVTTLFVPDRSPAAPLPPAREADVDRARFATLVQRQPFRPAVSPPPVEPEPAIAATPSFPYGAWTVTGLVEGPDGPEVWLHHAASGESRRLVVGEIIDVITFVGSRSGGDLAEFTAGLERFAVAVGHDLSRRRSVQ